ncbi:MAG: hypothetical protein J2P25_05275 [Nocardiopsaceae bacterium]|nr:hypothetical protein [Nocardiopsaceae bacterium]
MSFLAAAVASGSTSSSFNQAEPGVLGFLVVAGIGLALFFLLKNMNKQFKKLGPPPPEETDAESASGEAGEPGGPGEAVGSRGTVQTGDPEQDEKAQGTAKRK